MPVTDGNGQALERREFAKGYKFWGSIDGHTLGWTKAAVRFDYRNGDERIFFEFQCGLEVIEIPNGDEMIKRVNPRLERFAKAGEEHRVEVTQLDREGAVIGQWITTKGKLFEYALAWDNQADTVTPERIVFEAEPGSVVTG